MKPPSPLHPKTTKNRAPAALPQLNGAALSLLTAAALALPGLAPAADDDEVDFGYSHYQEGQRASSSVLLRNQVSGDYKHYALPKLDPIEVDSIHGNARTSLTDRLKFGFNYLEDTWAGATPYGSAPESSGAYGNKHYENYRKANGDYVITSASPFATKGGTQMDKQGHFYTINSYDPATDKLGYVRDRITHVMGYASPETRKQGDFKLGYEWDEAKASMGGGISTERDYESRFANLGGSLDFNHKRSTLAFNQSYTNSDVNASESTWPISHPQAVKIGGHPYLKGNRQDWTSHLGLTQVVNPDAVLNLGVGYSRNTGLLENPYKISWIGVYDPKAALSDGFYYLHGQGFYERRPDARNLVNANIGWTQYLKPFDAALHFNYQFSHDDWAIDSHSVTADWVQPLGSGWTLTPSVRYYSQSAANFYQAYLVTTGHNDTHDPRAIASWVYDHLPQSFSSDQRLSGYGAISGGLILSKKFTKGITLDTGFEYYSHQGGLKLGGDGEQAFADYDFWQANANLKLNLGAMGQGLDSHGSHGGHDNLPAGLMFAHTLEHAGEIMAGYRYQHSRQAGDWLHGDRSLTLGQASAKACPGGYDITNGKLDGTCSDMVATEMTQSMHMLELMVAPNDWLTLMLMPQFMDMDMTMRMTPAAIIGMGSMNMGNSILTQTAGIGDTGAYALVTLFEVPGHHIHAALGGTAPTGNVALQNHGKGTTENFFFNDYSMQRGSGTWDLKPSLTYTGKAQDWSWGGQLGGTWRAASRNASDYKLGDMFESSVWGGYDWTNWLASTVRLAYTWQGNIKGRFPHGKFYNHIVASCNKAVYTYADTDDQGNPIGDPVLHVADYNACLADATYQNRVNDSSYERTNSQYYPQNYGGHYVDLGLGISTNVGAHRLAFEWQQPMYTNVNGYQLNRDHFLTFTWSVGF